MRGQRAWKSWAVIAFMIGVAMVVTLQIDSFYLGLAAVVAAALTFGLVAELLAPPRMRMDRVAGSLVGGLVGFILAKLIGGQLLLPSILLGLALLLNMLPGRSRRLSTG